MDYSMARQERSSRRRRSYSFEERQEPYERRRQRRLDDDYALIDPNEEARLQDFDVEDTGRSVRARRAGLPGSRRNRF